MKNVVKVTLVQSDIYKNVNPFKYKLGLFFFVCRFYLREHKKGPRDYQLLKRYNVVQIWNTMKLIYPVAEGNSSIKHYATKEDIFGMIHDAYITIGHGEQNWMTKETQTKCKNITAENIMLCFSLCVSCLEKLKAPKKFWWSS